MCAREILMRPDGHGYLIPGTHRINARRAAFEFLERLRGRERRRLMALGRLERAVVLGLGLSLLA